MNADISKSEPSDNSYDLSKSVSGELSLKEKEGTLSQEQREPSSEKSKDSKKDVEEVPSQQEDDASDVLGTVKQPQGPLRLNKPPKTGLFMAVIFIVILFLSLAAGSSLLIAYGKVSVGSADFQDQIKSIIFSVPFLPKTPEYVLKQSVEAHKQISSAYIDASLSIDSQSLLNFYQNSNVDLDLTGKVDFSESKNPKLEFNAKYSKDLDVDVIYSDKMGYLRVNEVPESLLGSSFMYIPDSAKGIWIYNDFSRLETDASMEMELQKESLQETTSKKYSEIIETILSKDLLPNIKMTQEELEDDQTYKLQLSLTNEMFGSIMDSINSATTIDESLGYYIPSYSIEDPFKSCDIQVWIIKDSYYMKKIVLSVTFYESGDTVNPSDGLITPENLSQGNETNLVLILNLSRYGENFNITLPQGGISFEDFMLMLFEEAAKDIEEELSSESLDYSKTAPGISLDAMTELKQTPFGKYLIP